MKQLMSTIDTWQLQNQRVILRADLNVPLDKNGNIISDHRLRAVKPTIDLILKKRGTIVLITHLGRPKKPTPDLSTQLLVPWFIKNGYSIHYAATLEDAQNYALPQNSILLLENIRFFKKEQSKDQEFAQQLATLGTYYVSDAFGTLHRDHTSLTLLPILFPSDKRSIGLLIQREIHALNRLLYNPDHPFVAIIGGGKVNDKLVALEYLLPNIESILLGPAVVFTFLHAQAKPVGKSLVDTTMLHLCKTLSEHAQKMGKNIVIPSDYLVARDSFTGPLSYLDANQFAPWAVGISIGPHTIDEWISLIKRAKTIFYCGLMGDTKRKETLSGVNALFTAMAQSAAFTVISGGDSVAAAEILNTADGIDFCSTGGSATLAYLAGKQLPGLLPFCNN